MALPPDQFEKLKAQLAARREQFAPTPKPSYWQQVSEAAGAGIDRAKSGLDLAATPPNTTEVDQSAFNLPLGTTRAASGGIQTALSPLAPLFKPIADAFTKLIEGISNTKPLQEYGEGLADTTEPTGAEMLLEGASNVAEIAGAASGPKGVSGTARATAAAASKGREFLGNITSTGTQGIKDATANALDPAAIMQRVARVSKGKQVAFKEMAREGVGDYLVKRGIFGDVDQISEQLFSRFQQSRTSVDDALGGLPGTYKTTAVGNALKQLAQREQRISSPGAASRDLERVRELLKKHNGGGLDMSEINEAKRLFERNVRLDYVKENVPDKVEQANNIDSAIRKWQQTKASELGFKNIQDLNRETMLAKQLLDDLGLEYSGAAGNNAITLTDWVILAGGDPTAVGGFLAKKALSSRKVMSKIAKLRAGEKTTPLPEAQFGPVTIDGYAKFIRSIEDRAKQQSRQSQ